MQTSHYDKASVLIELKKCGKCLLRRVINKRHCMGTKTLNRMCILNKRIILGTAHHHGQTRPTNELTKS